MGTRRCHAGLPECCRWEESADEMARFERTVTPSVVNMLLLKGPAGRGVKRACRKGTFLPPYCPELNLIEILWRKIKYEWLPLDAYQNFKTLTAALFAVLKGIGSKYRITFA